MKAMNLLTGLTLVILLQLSQSQTNFLQIPTTKFHSESTKINHGDLYQIFVSAQQGVNPSTQQLVGEDIQSQTIQAVENLKAILE
jgi:enamine deaminase RidA (YjgF/YER057c/UK114 family)